ncbi:MAG: metallopeptidase TldD-related protein [Methylococcaceae bacterium]
MSFLSETRGVFDYLAEAAFTDLKQGEELNLNLSAEDQTYVRFNNSKVRQATDVIQRDLAVSMQCCGRKIEFSFDLTGQQDWDLATLRSLMERARWEALVLPEDPFMVPMQNNGKSDSHHVGELPSDEDVIECIATLTAGTDLTGLFASGPQIRAVRNSVGQDHWFSTETLFLDYSLFTINASGENKAVKGLYADKVWDQERFLTSIDASRNQLSLLKYPTRPIPPGEYRVYLAPPAVAEIIDMFSWGAISYNAWKRGDSALRRLIEGEACFSEKFSLKENFKLGLTPQFNSLGELPRVEVPIIEKGLLKNLLVSSRSAKEYGLTSNAADPGGWFGEQLRSAEVAAGNLAEADALKSLGTGLYVGNLHYLNWSDVQNARITGMTRYACFWVENGEPVEPIRDLRFDESLYRIFGTELESLTRETHIIPATGTYHRRALGGRKIPGGLLRAFRFTL